MAFFLAMAAPYFGELGFAELIVWNVRAVALFAAVYCGPESFGASPYFLMTQPDLSDSSLNVALIIKLRNSRGGYLQHSSNADRIPSIPSLRPPL